MSNRATRLILVIILVLLLAGNVPAPWEPCRGKQVGDPCQWG